MEVAKATLSGITKGSYKLHTLYQLTIITMMFCNIADSVNCSTHCNCFPVLPNDLSDPPTYNRVSESTNNTLAAVSCQRQQLTYVPTGLPSDTAVLFLAYNELTHLNRSMFAGLNMIRSLDVSHNKLKSIANDTFDDMDKLEQLDISYNSIQRLPRGFLCPWYKGEYISTMDEIGCDNYSTFRTVLRLFMGANEWHCTCRLQEFVEHFSCAGVFKKSPCIEFFSNKNDVIGHCYTPPSLREVPITRLSSSMNVKDSINVCKIKSRKVDIPLLVTMFSWMGAVFGYVIYFIWWNQREVTNHRSYLATLHKRQAETTDSEPRSRVQERPLTTDSVFIRESQSRGKPLPQQYEMKPVRKEKSLLAKKVQKGKEKESREVWVQRSESDASEDSGNAHLQTTKHNHGIQPYPRIIRVKPYQPPKETCRTSSETPPPRKKRVKSDVYCISSL